MTCGTEHVPGLRWPDLAKVRGSVSASRLIAALPCGEVPVLSAGGRGATVSPQVMLEVVRSLSAEVPVVIDCPGLTFVADELLVDAEAVHVLSGLQARHLADTETLLDDLYGTGVGLVTRSSSALGAEFEEVLDHLGVPHLAHLRSDPRVRRDGERGEWPGMRGPLRDSADRVVLDLLDSRGSGAA